MKVEKEVVEKEVKARIPFDGFSLTGISMEQKSVQQRTLDREMLSRESGFFKTYDFTEILILFLLIISFSSAALYVLLTVLIAFLKLLTI